MIVDYRVAKPLGECQQIIDIVIVEEIARTAQGAFGEVPVPNLQHDAKAPDLKDMNLRRR